MLAFLAVSVAVAQQPVITVLESRNLNPDPNGDPWYVDNYRLPADRNVIPDEELLETLNRLEASGDSLPPRVEHITSIHLRPIFVQSGGSCGAASQICYMFAYELNLYRNVPGFLPENIYPSHFTFMTADRNSTGAQLAIYTGIPNSVVFGGETYSRKYGRVVSDPGDYPEYGWMQGYDSWDNALHNRLQYNDFIQITSPEKLRYLKWWLYNHCGDRSVWEGGLAGTGLAISDAVFRKIPDNLYEGGKYILYEWGPQFDHAMTWAGYDDSVGYDFNRDGKITNDVDITGNGRVNMLDWERGALIALNSWGRDWMNKGWVYIPYRVAYKHKMSAEFYHVRKHYRPKLVFKVKMAYSQRNHLKLEVGIAQDPDANRPDKKRLCHHFIYQGRAPVPMLGRWADGTMHDEPMEFELDATDLAFGFDLTRPYTLFLVVTAGYSDPPADGKLYRLSVVDYAGNEEGNEIVADVSDTMLEGKGKFYYFAVRMPGNPAYGSPEVVYVDQRRFTIRYVDSEETAAEYSPARNAIDGNTKTIWHTRYSSFPDLPPHEIQIDMHDTALVAGLEYIPRDNGPNGRIDEYEVYVTLDPRDWGEPVATGHWRNTSEPEYARFEPKLGRYVRLRALREVNGNPWTSAAEINVLKVYGSTRVSENRPAVPALLNLEPCYPNPFNPSTRLRFHLARPGRVTLDVFNIRGERVQRLLNRLCSAGAHTVQFDGSDLPSGVYWAVLRASGHAAVRKMLLLK